MNSRQLATISILLLLTISLPLATAQVTGTGTSGYWDSSTYPNFSAVDRDTSGRANFTLGTVGNLAVGHGLQMDLRVNNIEGYREWNWWNGVEKIYYAIEITDGTTSVWGNFYLAEEAGIVIRTSQCLVGTEYVNPIRVWSYHVAQTVNATYTIQMINIGNNIINVRYGNPIDTHNAQNSAVIANTAWDVMDQNFTVPANFLTNPSTTAKLYVGHEGNGKFDIQFSLKQLNGEITTPIVTGQDPVESQGNWWNQLTEIAGGIWSLVLIAVSILKMLLPYTVWIIIGLAIFVLYSCWRAKSAEPLTNFLGFLWGLILGVIDTFAHVVDVIRGLFRI